MSGAQPSGAALHHAIIQGFLARGYAPTIGQLAAELAATPESVAAGLNELARARGVVLHPVSGEVWVAHPFSNAPTGFVVKNNRRTWWGNCAWCSLGIAALVSGATTISARLGGEGRLIDVRVRGDEVLDTDYVVHFPVPLRVAWDNVIYTCSMMQFFETPSDVDTWCTNHGVVRGDVRPVSQVWPFARDWYGRHADADWHKWTPDEARAILTRHGLTGPHWDL